MIKFVATAAMAAVLLAPLGVGAQTPLPLPGSLPPYGPGIGLDVARKMLDAAVAEAGKNGWQEAIAIVDSGGRLVAFFRMDNTQLASIEIALGKVVAVNNVKRPTKALQDSVAPGSSTPRMQGLPGITPVDGGLPTDQPADWPSLDEVRAYRQTVRALIDACFDPNEIAANPLSADESPAQLLEVAIRLGSLAVVLGLWQIFGAQVDPVLFTTPSKIAAAAVTMIASGELWTYLWPSLVVLALGLSLAAVIGIASPGAGMSWPKATLIQWRRKTRSRSSAKNASLT